ncbi:MAG TPA: hypothetical protein VI643_05575 [Planctomycetota bacterium]|nr:hypothetical protein [Planctomycetota bacterium]
MQRAAIRVTIALLCVMTAGCSDGSPTGPKHLLQWKLASGEEFKLQLKQKQTAKYTGKATKPPPPIDSTIEAELVLRIVKEGSAGEFELAINAISLSIRGTVAGADMDLEYREGRWVKEEIQAPGSAADPKQMLEDFKQTLVRPSPGRARSYGLKPVEAAGGLALFSFLYRALPLLPREPVAVGATWIEQAPVGTFSSMSSLGMADMSNHFEGLEEESGRRIAKIATYLEHTVSDQGTSMKVSRSRNARLDVEGGHFVYATDDVSMTGNGWDVRVLAEVVLSRRK